MKKTENNIEQEFKDAVDFLLDIPRFTTKNSLEHTKAFLKELGDPQENFKVIHVAGSNGKGSVCMFIDHILQKEGKRTGLFTSPHLEDIRERFVVNGQMCGKEEFLQVFKLTGQAVDRMQKKNFPHPTFFEFIFAMGMLLFSRAQVEYAIVETGLGGRLDATNTVEHPLMTIITSISLEHTEILGDTIEQIAMEKAGILRPHVPLVCDGTSEEAVRVITAKAEKIGCSYCVIRPDMCKINEFNHKFIDFYMFTEYDKGTRWRIPFVSGYQVMNAALAVTAMRMMPVEDRPSDHSLKTGLAEGFWPGRMEEIMPEVYLDGAHNTDGIRVFMETADRISAEDSYRPLLLFSMVKEKDYHTAVSMLTAENWEAVTVTHIPGPRGLSEQELMHVFEENGNGVTECVPDLKEAFEQMLSRKKAGQKLFCTGSLYFVGALRSYIRNWKKEE